MARWSRNLASSLQTAVIRQCSLAFFQLWEVSRIALKSKLTRGSCKLRRTGKLRFRRILRACTEMYKITQSTMETNDHFRTHARITRSTWIRSPINVRSVQPKPLIVSRTVKPVRHAIQARLISCPQSSRCCSLYSSRSDTTTAHRRQNAPLLSSRMTIHLGKMCNWGRFLQTMTAIWILNKLKNEKIKSNTT